MTTVADETWAGVRQKLLDQVFYAHSADEVERSTDLAASGYIDSLSVVAVLEVMIEVTGNEDALTFATVEDFRSLNSIRQLFERL